MEGFIKAAVIENQFEAELLKEILDDRGIPHFIKSYYDIAYDGLFQRQMGWGAVYAPAEKQGEVIELLDSLRSQLQA